MWLMYHVGLNGSHAKCLQVMIMSQAYGRPFGQQLSCDMAVLKLPVGPIPHEDLYPVGFIDNCTLSQPLFLVI